MSKIIACIDGSLVTNTVCDYAAWFSDKLNSPIKLLHVIDKPKAKAPQDKWCNWSRKSRNLAQRIG